MTTIAVTKNQIACDLQIYHASGYKFKTKTKIYEFQISAVYPKPFCIGYAGNVDGLVPVLDWLADPTTKPPRVSSSEFVVLTSDHKIFTFANPSQWFAVDQPFYAIGSGATFALGAMGSGATALDAVKAASKFDPMTGMGFKHIDYK
jgi:hypothetical protein